MAKNVQDLDSIDLMKITVGEITAMKDSVLQRAIVAALRDSIAAADGASHTNHWAFGSHMKSVALEAISSRATVARS
jgi:hypothetical protein